MIVGKPDAVDKSGNPIEYKTLPTPKQAMKMLEEILDRLIFHFYYIERDVKKHRWFLNARKHLRELSVDKIEEVIKIAGEEVERIDRKNPEVVTFT
jgi:hypothetical protein